MEYPYQIDDIKIYKTQNPQLKRKRSQLNLNRKHLKIIDNNYKNKEDIIKFSLKRKFEGLIPTTITISSEPTIIKTITGIWTSPITIT